MQHHAIDHTKDVILTFMHLFFLYIYIDIVTLTLIAYNYILTYIYNSDTVARAEFISSCS